MRRIDDPSRRNLDFLAGMQLLEKMPAREYADRDLRLGDGPGETSGADEHPSPAVEVVAVFVRDFVDVELVQRIEDRCVQWVLGLCAHEAAGEKFSGVRIARPGAFVDVDEDIVERSQA